MATEKPHKPEAGMGRKDVATPREEARRTEPKKLMEWLGSPLPAVRDDTDGPS